MINWIEEHQQLSGIYNCSSPHPVTNAEFMRLLRKATKTRIGLPAATWMLKLGARLIGTETELVLKSRWVLPTRILATGFHFEFEKLEDAFRDILQRVPSRQYRLLG
jgi:NAD dependent epimerase/dehydratase family enzyme